MEHVEVVQSSSINLFFSDIICLFLNVLGVLNCRLKVNRNYNCNFFLRFFRSGTHRCLLPPQLSLTQSTFAGVVLNV